MTGTMAQILQLFDTLDRQHQFLAIEKLLAHMRRNEGPDPAAMAKETIDESDFNAPYPIPEGAYSPRQLEPRGER